MNNEIPAQSLSWTAEVPVDIEAHAAEDVTQEFLPVDGDNGEIEVDAFTDDLSKELNAAAAKTWRNRATVVLGALALVVGGFLGGVMVQKHFGKSPTTSASGRANAFTGGGFPGGFTRNSGGNGGGTGGTGGSTAGGAEQTGTVKLVDGTTIYVQMANGDVITVRTSGSTKVSLAAPAKVSSLKAGQQVSFTGSTDASTGTVTATSVTAAPAKATK